jgi:DNA-binding GntR family transcriptional regulator
MREEAYRELRRLIVEGDLAPGERLRDKHIAAWPG